MLETVIDYVLMFFFFSAVGWTIESIYCSVGNRKVINRGFLYGPLCPIYGTGALVFEICVKPLSQPVDKRFIVVILLGMVLADTVEYLTSFIMEKLFHARWWDYTDYFCNINGRICLKHTFYWGFFSFLFVYVISPVYSFIESFIPQSTRMVLTGVILTVFLFDLVLTVKSALDIQKIMTKLESLKLNITTAAEAVKVTAETIKGSAESKYEDIQDTLSANSAKFNEWKADVSKQYYDVKKQIEELRDTQKTPKYSKRTKRLFANLSTVRKGAGKAVAELETAWEDIKAKFKDDDSEMF